MQSFRTIFPPFEADFDLNHQNQILSIGSCFAEHISGRLSKLKFQSILNPFGIVYNPISVLDTLKWLNSDKNFSENDLFEHQGLWHSFKHHGQFSNPNKLDGLSKINDGLKEGRAFLKKVDRLILTFGTAHVFESKKTGKVVANCHKLPSQQFIRRRLSTEEVYECLNQIFEIIRNINPQTKIILTVSPVRHIRDGLVENQKSKATLLLSIDKLLKHNPKSAFYFPSYEIVLDDLRDYRFFKKDLIHPNDMAIQYVWEYFEKAFFNEKTLDLNRKIEKIQNSVAHRPLHIQSEAHQSFIRNQLLKIEELESGNLSLDFTKERKSFESQLI